MTSTVLKISGLLISAGLLAAGCVKTENGGGDPTIKVTSLHLNTATLELAIGEEAQLTAIVSPSNASDGKVTWGTSNAKVVSVTETGLVRGISEGSATVTATAGGKQSTCAVTVSNAVISAADISLDRSSLEIEIGESCTLSATVIPDNATDKTVTWVSDNPSTADVSATGTVTGVTEGNTTIRAKISGHEASCQVNVVPRIVHVTSIVLSETEAEVYLDETYTLSAEVIPDDATDKTIEWSSSSPAVATVEDGVIIPVSPGTTTIFAKADGVSASCSVSILEHPQPLAFQEMRRPTTKASAGYSWTPTVEFYVGRGSRLMAQAYEPALLDRMFDVNLLAGQPSTDYSPLIYWPIYEGSGPQQTIYYHFLAHSKLGDGISREGFGYEGYGQEDCFVSYKADLTEGYHPRAFKISSIVADREKSNTQDNIINLSFTYPMAQLVLSAVVADRIAADPSVKIVLKEVSISKLKTSARLCVGYSYGNTTLSWQDCTRENDVVLFAGEKEISSGSSYTEVTSADDDNTIAIIPQTVSSDAKLVVSYKVVIEDPSLSGGAVEVNNQNTRIFNVPEGLFKGQTRYDLFLSFDSSGFDYWVNVQDWNNENATVLIN